MREKTNNFKNMYSKTINNVMFVTLFISAIVIITGCTDHADYTVYKNIYEGYQNRYQYGITTLRGYFEVGYEFFMLVCISLGIGFQGFFAIYGAIGLLLVANFIYRYTERPAVVFSLYLLFPFILDVIQIRNLMAYSIVLFSFRYLQVFSKKNLFRFLLCILLASTQHSSALIYVVFVIVYIKSMHRVAVISAIFTICAGIVALIGADRLFLWIIPYIPKLQYYIEYKITLLNAAKVIITGMFSTAIVIGITLLKRKRTRHTVTIKDKQQYSDMLLKAGYVGMVLVGISLFASSFDRFQRNMLIVYYCIFANWAGEKESGFDALKQRRGCDGWQFICGSLIYGFAIFNLLWTGAGVFTGTSNHVIRVLQSNILVQWLNC